MTVPEPFFESHVKTHSAEEAFENVLADVGCNVPMLDDHDSRVIGETRAGTTTYRGSKSGLPGLPDSQADVGGWEHYPEIHRAADWDTDGDGIRECHGCEYGQEGDVMSTEFVIYSDYGEYDVRITVQAATRRRIELIKLEYDQKPNVANVT